MSDRALLVLLLVSVGVMFVTVVMLMLVRKPMSDMSGIQQAVLSELRSERQVAAEVAKSQRGELQAGLSAISDSLRTSLGQVNDAMANASKGSAEASDKLRDVLANSISQMQEGNEKKLEEMRVTVDEKLQGTLEKRLGESFSQVSERLQAVHKALGEMQNLATGVGDLKRMLTNVSTRGSFGEVQLRAILEQILSPDQYQENYCPREESGERVEFAIRLPGRDAGAGPLHLPVDSKFPQEDYLRLLDAHARNDAEGMREAHDALIRQVRTCAKSIRDKYISPPATTEFAILFLPTESLFAEVLREPGLVEDLQREYHISLTGPTTFAAFLNSLRMGFRTLALEQRAGQVWEILGAVKTEFGKFGEVIAKLKKQLSSATVTLDNTSRRARAMERKLREVEEMSPEVSAKLIGIAAGVVPDGDDEGDEPADAEVADADDEQP